METNILHDLSTRINCARQTNNNMSSPAQLWISTWARRKRIKKVNLVVCCRVLLEHTIVSIYSMLVSDTTLDSTTTAKLCTECSLVRSEETFKKIRAVDSLVGDPESRHTSSLQHRFFFAPHTGGSEGGVTHSSPMRCRRRTVRGACLWRW